MGIFRHQKYDSFPISLSVSMFEYECSQAIGDQSGKQGTDTVH